MSKKERVIKLTIGWGLFIISVGLVYYVNYLCGFSMEEGRYATLLYSDEKIKNLLDIFNAQKWHYMNCGGRSIVYTLLQAAVIAGDVCANGINTCMTVVTAIILTAIAELVTRQKECFANRLLYVDGVIGLILGLNANWRQTLCEQSGAVNYLWITIFILLFVWVYMREIPYDCFGSKEPLWGVNVWIIPLALIAGWSNENMGIAVSVFSIITINYVRKVDHIVQSWMILGSVFSFIGTVLCIISPGNWGHLKTDSISSQVVVRILVEKGFAELRGFFDYLLPAILVTVVLIAIVKGVCNQKLGREVTYVLTLALISWVAMILSPNYTDAAAYGTMIFLLLSQVVMIKNILGKKPALKIYTWIVALIIWGNGMYRLTQYVGTSLNWL